MEDESKEYWKEKNKRDNQNGIVFAVLFVGGIIVSSFIGSLIPAIVGFAVGLFVYARDMHK